METDLDVQLSMFSMGQKLKISTFVQLGLYPYFFHIRILISILGMQLKTNLIGFVENLPLIEI